VEVLHAPNDDHAAYGPLTREKLRTALQAAHSVVKAIEAGKNVLVTCAAGLNRSGLVSTLALHFLYGWSGDRCIQHVRLHRPAKQGMCALSNADFTRALLHLPGES
jgi:protein-tyrosine phosphatase